MINIKVIDLAKYRFFQVVRRDPAQHHLLLGNQSKTRTKYVEYIIITELKNLTVDVLIIENEPVDTSNGH